MLTRELLAHRLRNGVLKPSFVALKDPALRELAQQLLGVVEAAVNRPYGELEQDLAELAGAAPRPKIARGLVKLLLDRVEVLEPEAEHSAQRLEVLRAAVQVRTELRAGSTFAAYEEALTQQLGRPLTEVREHLYDDLESRRPVLGFRSLGAEALLERYNLALAQGPLLSARRLTLEASGADVVIVRRVLRHLKFCRLVAEVALHPDGFTLVIDGPGSLLGMQKKYGLQLASFLGAVPLLPRWRLEAEVSLGRGPVTMVLSSEDPLVSPMRGGSGYVPPEVRALAEGFESETWRIDLTATPRHVGARGVCVPDFSFVREQDGATFALELFHAWHHGALERRLRELTERADPALLLGVERGLAKDPAFAARLEKMEQVFLFSTFPSARKVLQRLERMGSQAEA